jgi:hypothetical protein
VPVKKRKKKKKQREAGATVRPCWAGVRAGNAIKQLKALRILDEDVAVPQIELITRHWSTALSSPPITCLASPRETTRSLGAEEYVPDRGHSNCDRDQADCQEKQSRRPPLSLLGLGRRLDNNSVLFPGHGESL